MNRIETADILRTLIDRSELKPVKIEGKKTLAIDRHGHLAGSLSLANKAEAGIGEDVAEKCTAMLGARNMLCAIFVIRGLGGA